jgi:uncharacterized membrane protein YecN with MAPEG domain
MNTLHITLLLAGLCVLLQITLTALVIVRRAQTGVDWLDGGDQRLLRRIRAHGNFSETAPMALLLMAFLELRGLPVAWLWSMGGCFFVGRLLHAVSLLTDNKAWSRRGGMVLTLFVLSLQGFLCIWLFFQ